MGKGMVLTGIKWGNLREEDHLKGSGDDGRIILKRIFKKWDGAIDRIDLAHDRLL
jgi:hypothetical protein